MKKLEMVDSWVVLERKREEGEEEREIKEKSGGGEKEIRPLQGGGSYNLLHNFFDRFD